MPVRQLLLIVLGALLLAGTARAQSVVFITELADPDNNASARYVELYNGSNSPVDLTGWTLQRYTNENATATGVDNLAGTIPAKGFYIVAVDPAEFEKVYGFAPDLDGSSGGPSDSNGDDNVELLNASDESADIFGVPGEDGTGTAHEFEDGRAERKAFVTQGNATWDANDWNVDNDSGGGEGTQNAPDDFDPDAWVGHVGAETAVQFTAASASVVEGDAGTTTYDVTVSITDPDDDDDTTAEVVVTGGTATSGSDYSYPPTQVTFPAGSSDDQTVSVTIIGGAGLESDETIMFELQSVSGGDNASAGTPSAFTLTIMDDDAPLPTLVINEFLADPALNDEETTEVEGDANGDGTRDSGDDEFVEILNVGASATDLAGFSLSDGTSVRHTFPAGTVLDPGQLVVVFGGGEPNLDESGSVVQTSSSGGFGLNNGGDVITLSDDEGALLASVEYGGDTGIDGGNAQALARDPDGSGSFVLHTTIASNSVSFSPGEANVGAPVEMLTINGTAGEDGADAGWRMLAAPVAGATRADLGDDVTFSTGTGEMFYTWNGADWVTGTSNTPLTSGTGFILYLFDDATDPVNPDLRLDVPGMPPNGDVTTSGLDQNDMWHLLGNPYGQSFDLSGLGLAGSGFQAVAHVWDPASGTYQLITESGDASDLVAAWQGFFVQRSEAGSGAASLTFDAASRTTGATFYGKQGQGVTVASHRKLGLRLRAFDESGAEAARDEAASLYFGPQATSGWDAYDAAKANVPPNAVRAELAFLGEYGGGMIEKAQESRTLDPEAFEVELRARIEGAGGKRVLEWPVWEHVPAAWTLELTDRATSTTVDLRAQADYMFVAAEYEGPRFVLRVGATATATDEMTLPEHLALSVPHPNPARALVRLAYALPAASDVRMAVYDVLGREVAVVAEGPRAAGVQELTWQVPARLSAGFYVVRLEAGAQVRSQRLVVVR